MRKKLKSSAWKYASHRVQKRKNAGRKELSTSIKLRSRLRKSRRRYHDMISLRFIPVAEISSARILRQ
jgi:hypothetical protein